MFTNLDPEGTWGWWDYWMGVDVNSRGQVIATGTPLEVNLPDHVRPLLLDQGRIIDLMGSHPKAGAAIAINGRGQVLGVACRQPAPARAPRRRAIVRPCALGSAILP